MNGSTPINYSALNTFELTSLGGYRFLFTFLVSELPYLNQIWLRTRNCPLCLLDKKYARKMSKVNFAISRNASCKLQISDASILCFGIK